MAATYNERMTKEFILVVEDEPSIREVLELYLTRAGFEVKAVSNGREALEALESWKPEDLWNWLDLTADATGASFIAIPHNSNISGGLMFSLADSYGALITPDYAETRMRWEPLVEITQIKGDSETHPMISPTDEFAELVCGSDEAPFLVLADLRRVPERNPVE